LAKALVNRPRGGTYLEIGLNYGGTFRAMPASLKIGVDPILKSRRMQLLAQVAPWVAPLASLTAGGSREYSLVYRMTSDSFFARSAAFLRRRKIDVAFVDGLHNCGQVLRDVDNCLSYLAAGGVIAIHDCDPPSATAALPDLDEARRQPDFDGKWHGDVWRAIVQLRATRRDLRVCVLDCDEGIGLVSLGQGGDCLDLSPAEVDSLGYEDLAARRDDLLCLRPPDYLIRYLEEARA
jgi:hypothetical protein